MTLATFLKVNPPKFKRTTNLTEADTWFQAMEQTLQVQLVPEEQCVKFLAICSLGKRCISGRKHDAFCSMMMMLSAEMPSRWNFIKNKFEELFKFSRMCQGTLGDFEEWKCIKYEGGLRSDILSSVGRMEIRTFSELVNKSRVVEEYVKKVATEKGSPR
ncbi:uncharacterized protein LOC107465141 [Arachis duranensis]|uniref:Uncharacterized protein LOC107465141 n=1 Tax=Arachis duranensis TaxID=130453 RepID=A0A6P4C542_ARADU|nr:uncharacterized protein LOC107465141 [Arachis duranensis]